jgi:hypothetical protein
MSVAACNHSFRGVIPVAALAARDGGHIGGYSLATGMITGHGV